jgi:hypothetical protein
MKDTFYFSHDYNTRSDNKIKRLMAKYGILGYGIFWAIIEDLYNNANALPLDCDCIAYDLRVQSDVIKSIIYDFDLFTINCENFSSESVNRRLLDRDNKSVKARKSANIGWEKRKSDANAKRTQSDSNAIKESKVKESNKKKVIKEKITPEEFYKNQIELSGNDENYKTYIKALWGKNEANIKLNGILSLEDQLTYDQFLKLLEKAKLKKESITALSLTFENGNYYKGKKSLYLSINDWLNKRT